ncbi:MAG: Mur ligase domain-containing protein, partial [Clostridia bacterium]
MESFFGRRIHFVGVGGISMSALARFAIQQGAVVSGSDGVDSALIDELRCIGAKIVIGVDISVVENCDTVVFSSAIKPTHPEIVEAHRLNLQVFERHEFLGQIASQFETVVAVAGTHGKTTVTAMIAHILKSLSVSFLANIGGIASGLSNYVQNGEDIQLFVAEACEYKQSLLSLKPSIGVVTNIECDHPDCYESLDAITAV